MQQNMQRSSISEMRFPFPIFHFILFVENDEENREVNACVHRYFHCLGRNRIKSIQSCIYVLLKHLPCRRKWVKKMLT